MDEQNKKLAKEYESGVIYGLNDKPPFVEAFLAALQHVLAVFVGIITPPLIICNAFGLGIEDTSYIVSMSLFISGVATFIQAKKIGPIGSGLLSIQGTSFTFLGPIIGAGMAAISGGASPAEALALVFGVALAGSFIEMILSRFLDHARKIITPLVTGIVVTLIGLTLVKVGIISMGGGFGAMKSGNFASFQSLALSFGVMAIIILLNRSKSKYLRMSSIFIGLLIGYIASIFLGLIDFNKLKDLPAITVPLPFKYGLGFSWSAFISIGIIYIITTIESIGDLTATSTVSGEPIEGDVYFKRISGGVLGDGFNSFLASIFNTFPNTTFSQNNGVIQLTGVASRYVGYFIAAILVIFGFFPIVGGIFKIMPEPVLGGATIVLFGTVAAAGIRILNSIKLTNRDMIILAVSLAMGLGVTLVPDILKNMPQMVKNIFASGITTGGIFAIFLNILLPKEK